MEVLSKSTTDTKELAGSVAKSLKPGAVLALYGDLGSGKTTFTTYLVHALGIEKRVQSPTFVLLREYAGGSGKITKVHHLDLYRVESKEGLSDLGIQELFEEKAAITVIEWPEIAEEALPEDTLKIYFEYVGEGERKICVQNLN